MRYSKINPMTFAQTILLEPKTLPSKREADNSTARVVMPLIKTATYKYLPEDFDGIFIYTFGYLIRKLSPDDERI